MPGILQLRIGRMLYSNTPFADEGICEQSFFVITRPPPMTHYISKYIRVAQVYIQEEPREVSIINLIPDRDIDKCICRDDSDPSRVAYMVATSDDGVAQLKWRKTRDRPGWEVSWDVGIFVLSDVHPKFFDTTSGEKKLATLWPTKVEIHRAAQDYPAGCGTDLFATCILTVLVCWDRFDWTDDEKKAVKQFLLDRSYVSL
ncbi:hypothetical protein B0H15DRAFT_187714 [Mycena belliarum]|uniref:Uncharacterized protein n=1 Tax=Mycena belliarum TaxID=1033014 RepID=A0AAD6XKD2_9AGAR|nr:hypothetical protein B0H15DRAFT_187714 [Mycena belliae]